jgi:hypothetical protein
MVLQTENEKRDVKKVELRNGGPARGSHRNCALREGNFCVSNGINWCI